MLQELLFYVPLFDVLQLLPLLLLALQSLLRAASACLARTPGLRRLTPTCACCGGGRSGSGSGGNGSGGQSSGGGGSLVDMGQRLYYAYVYGRCAMVVSVGTLFACVAPTVVVLVLLWLCGVRLVWQHTLTHVLSPPQGRGFDGGGAFWPTVMQRQVVAPMRTLTLTLTLTMTLALALTLTQTRSRPASTTTRPPTPARAS